MKNHEYPFQSIIAGMDILLLTTTNDIEQLRTLALVIARKVVTEKMLDWWQKNSVSAKTVKHVRVNCGSTLVVRKVARQSPASTTKRDDDMNIRLPSFSGPPKFTGC
jgi:hypothetical protein